VEGPEGPDEEAAARLADHARRALAAPRKDERTFTVRAAPPAGDREADELQAIEQQVLDFQREAEDARQKAERAFERISQDLRDRLAPPPEPFGPGTAPPASVPLAPAAPFLPVPKAPPAPASASTPASAPVPATGPAPPVEPPPGAPGPPPLSAVPPLPQPPPWRFWFDGGPPDPRPPAKVIADVRAAVIATLESAGARLRGLAPDEYVTVAVDFVSAGVFVSQVRPARTVVVRARKQDLDARLRGQLSADELRRRVEVSEY
jgi:hypothetical protein